MNPTTARELQEAYLLIKVGHKRDVRSILLPILRANENIADA